MRCRCASPPREPVARVQPVGVRLFLLQLVIGGLRRRPIGRVDCAVVSCLELPIRRSRVQETFGAVRGLRGGFRRSPTLSHVRVTRHWIGGKSRRTGWLSTRNISIQYLSIQYISTQNMFFFKTLNCCNLSVSQYGHFSVQYPSIQYLSTQYISTQNMSFLTLELL